MVSLGTRGLAAEGAVLWEADLTGLQPGPAPQFGASVEVKEQDGIKILSKENSETEFLFAKDVMIANPQMWGSYTFKIRFREQEKATVTLVIKSRGDRSDVDYMQYYVGIGQNSLGTLCHGMPKVVPGVAADDPRRGMSVTYEDLGANPLPVGEWITAEVTVGEELIHVSVDAGDGIERAADFTVFPGNGGISVLARSPVDISSVVVREAEAPVAKTP